MGGSDLNLYRFVTYLTSSSRLGFTSGTSVMTGGLLWTVWITGLGGSSDNDSGPLIVGIVLMAGIVAILVLPRLMLLFGFSCTGIIRLRVLSQRSGCTSTASFADLDICCGLRRRVLLATGKLVTFVIWSFNCGDDVSFLAGSICL